MIAEAIRLIHQNEPIDSERSQEIARRYLAMQDRSLTDGSKRHDVVISDAAEASNVHDSFLELRTEVHDFLQKVVQNYQAQHQHQ